MNALQDIPQTPDAITPAPEPQPAAGMVTLYHAVSSGDAARIQATGFQPGRRGLFASRPSFKHPVWFNAGPVEGWSCVAVRFPVEVVLNSFDSVGSIWAVPADVADYWLFMQ